MAFDRPRRSRWLIIHVDFCTSQLLDGKWNVGPWVKYINAVSTCNQKDDLFHNVDFRKHRMYPANDIRTSTAKTVMKTARISKSRSWSDDTQFSQRCLRWRKGQWFARPWFHSQGWFATRLIFDKFARGRLCRLESCSDWTRDKRSQTITQSSSI